MRSTKLICRFEARRVVLCGTTLYAAQQALAWSLDPLNFESPLAMIGWFNLNNREDSKDCCPSTDPRVS
jgi:hypothetical protein